MTDPDQPSKSWYRDIFVPWISVMFILGMLMCGVLLSVLVLIWASTLLWTP